MRNPKPGRGRRAGKGRHTGRLADFTDLFHLIDKNLLRARVWVTVARVIKPKGEGSHWSVQTIEGRRQTFIEVETQPDGLDLTCRLPAIGGVSIVPPEGSEVLVVLPSGKIDFMPFVLPVGDTHERTQENRTVMTAATEVELVVGGRILRVKDGEIQLGGAAVEKVIKGTTYRANEAALHSAMTTFLGGLSTYVGAIQSIADPTGIASALFGSAIANLGAAIATFEGAAASYLSGVSKTE